MNNEWILALIGGGLIGLAATLLLWLNGHIAGVSGIVNGALVPEKGDFSWRICFILGLLLGGLFMMWFDPKVFASVYEAPWPMTFIAGLLVGVGTIMGSGCTSGHGVCGLSRLSLRSIVATFVFMAAGMAMVRFVL